jgi:hypothetical protein
MLRFLLAVMIATSLVVSGSAQDPKSIELKLEGFSIQLTDISVVTGDPSNNPGGGQPANIVPLAADKLYEPDAGVWIQFSYKTDFKKGDAADSLTFLAAAIDLPKGKGWAYQGANLDSATGKGWIRIFPQYPMNKTVVIEESFNLTAYGMTKNGQHKKIVSKEKILVKFRRDGIVTLTQTRYEELKAGLRRLEELERKVKELEKSK